MKLQLQQSDNNNGYLHFGNNIPITFTKTDYLCDIVTYIIIY